MNTLQIRFERTVTLFLKEDGKDPVAVGQIVVDDRPIIAWWQVRKALIYWTRNNPDRQGKPLGWATLLVPQMVTTTRWLKWASYVLVLGIILRACA